MRTARPTFNNILFKSMLLTLLLFAQSCSKEHNESVNKGKATLAAYIGNEKDLGLLNAAMKRAGIYQDDDFINGSPFTIFAPVDSAFQKAGLTLAKIQAYNPAALALLLKYSIVTGRITTKSLVGFYSQRVVSLNPQYRPAITKNYSGIFINGIPLVQANIELGDGVVHKTGKVNFPPEGNLWGTIKKLPELSFFVAAINRLPDDYQGNKNIKALLQLPNTIYSPNGFTVFAPDNAGFQLFGYPDIAAVNNTDPANLQSIVNACVGDAPFYTSDFLGGFGVGFFPPRMRTVYDGYMYKILEDGKTIQTNGNITLIRLVKTDIIATNGVLHITNQLIKP